MMSFFKNGFSLLEVVMTLTIIMILASITYPTYTHYLLKARRERAEILLLTIAARLENYHSTQDTYQGATPKKLKINPRKEPYYHIIINPMDGQHYQITAIPKGSQTKDHCGKLTLNEIGERNPKEKCW